MCNDGLHILGTVFMKNLLRMISVRMGQLVVDRAEID